MKLFISWSGDRSKQVALALRHWLPTVIQQLKPWMSDVDLQKGSEWNQELTAELEGTSFGLFCLTPENRSSLWLLFEAGAIAKRKGTKRVYTYLSDLDDNDVPWPLAQFQATKATKDDTLKMLEDMNKHLKEPLEPAVLQNAFNRGWPELENTLKTLKTVPKQAGGQEHKTKTEMMLEEILGYVRQQARQDALRPEETGLYNLRSLVEFGKHRDIWLSPKDLKDIKQHLEQRTKSIEEFPMPPVPKKTPPTD